MSNDKQEFVIKSNTLIQSYCYDYTEIEYKAIAYICSIYRKNEKNVDNIDTYRFSFQITDFAKACGIDSHGGKVYNLVRKAIRTLEQKSDWIPVYDKDGKEWTTSVSWISKAYFDKNDRVEFYADRDLYWHICGLKNRFTIYERQMYMSMHGKHALRLYELLKSYEGRHLWKINIEMLKKYMFLHAKVKYENNHRFIHDVLEPAIREINDKTNLNVEISYEKEGNKFSFVTFSIGKEKRRKVC